MCPLSVDSQLLLLLSPPRNEVNGGDTVFVRCVCLSVCVCLCVQQTSQSDQFKMVKATDFKFDVHVPRDSLDVTP